MKQKLKNFLSKALSALLVVTMVLAGSAGVTLAKYISTFSTSGFTVSVTGTTGTTQTFAWNTSAYPASEPAGNTAATGVTDRAVCYGNPTGGISTYEVQASGYYLLEVWGAQGGNCIDHTPGRVRYGGLGGYSAGYAYLEKGETLYVVLGGQGQGTACKQVDALGGYNGGGLSSKYSGSATTVNHVYGAGGGATHIAKVTGTLKDIFDKSQESQVLIVAGGGGGARLQTNAGTDDAARWGNGGSGGGLPNSDDTYLQALGVYKDNTITQYTEAQLKEIANTTSNAELRGVGESCSSGQAAGGAGWYGGRSGNTASNGVYMGVGSGGTGYLASAIQKGISEYGVQAGSGEAKITYITKDITKLTDISSPSKDTLPSITKICNATATSLSLNPSLDLPSDVVAGESFTLASMPDAAALNEEAAEEAPEHSEFYGWYVDSGMAQDLVMAEDLEETLYSVYEMEPEWEMTLTPLYKALEIEPFIDLNVRGMENISVYDAEGRLLNELEDPTLPIPEEDLCLDLTAADGYCMPETVEIHLNGTDYVLGGEGAPEGFVYEIHGSGAELIIPLELLSGQEVELSLWAEAVEESEAAEEAADAQTESSEEEAADSAETEEPAEDSDPVPDTSEEMDEPVTDEGSSSDDTTSEESENNA